mmetsp:Transcript_14574/g.22935  ORF Transcript_14574/g.22935 Transcript_14574/m.22935 type:complete len:511 (+) Transcript_14574:341-1873(+)
MNPSPPEEEICVCCQLGESDEMWPPGVQEAQLWRRNLLSNPYVRRCLNGAAEWGVEEPDRGVFWHLTEGPDVMTAPFVCFRPPRHLIHVGCFWGILLAAERGAAQEGPLDDPQPLLRCPACRGPPIFPAIRPRTAGELAAEGARPVRAAAPTVVIPDVLRGLSPAEVERFLATRLPGRANSPRLVEEEFIPGRAPPDGEITPPRPHALPLLPQHSPPGARQEGDPRPAEPGVREDGGYESDETIPLSFFADSSADPPPLVVTPPLATSATSAGGGAAPPPVGGPTAANGGPTPPPGDRPAPSPVPLAPLASPQRADSSPAAANPGWSFPPVWAATSDTYSWGFVPLIIAAATRGRPPYALDLTQEQRARWDDWVQVLGDVFACHNPPIDWSYLVRVSEPGHRLYNSIYFGAGVQEDLLRLVPGLGETVQAFLNEWRHHLPSGAAALGLHAHATSAGDGSGSGPILPLAGAPSAPPPPDPSPPGGAPFASCSPSGSGGGGGPPGPPPPPPP